MMRSVATRLFALENSCSQAKHSVVCTLGRIKLFGGIACGGSQEWDLLKYLRNYSRAGTRAGETGLSR